MKYKGDEELRFTDNEIREIEGHPRPKPYDPIFGPYKQIPKLPLYPAMPNTRQYSTQYAQTPKPSGIELPKELSDMIDRAKAFVKVIEILGEKFSNFLES